MGWMEARETVKSLKKKFPIKRQTCSAQEGVDALRRVLKMADSFFAMEDETKLTASKRGDLLTYGEVRYHIKSALALKLKGLK